MTLVAGDAPLSISDHRSRTPEELAAALGWAAASQWSPNWWPMDGHVAVRALPRARRAVRRSRLEQGPTCGAAMFDAVQRPARRAAPRRDDTARARERRRRPRAEVDGPRSGSLIVVAGGEAGRFSAVFGPCDGMRAEVVTKEIRWST